MSYEFEVQWRNDEDEIIAAERLCARDQAAVEAWAAKQERFEMVDYDVIRVEEDDEELGCSPDDLNEDGVSESSIGYGPTFRVGPDA
jgi:hypothetical protein